MSLPVPQKNWQITTLVSDLTGNDEGNQQSLTFKVKQQRKLFGHVVAGSGDDTTARMDGFDRFISPSDITKGSWIVITQPGSGAQDLFARSTNPAENDWQIWHSPSGAFTGGGVHTFPTAVDGTQLYSNSFYGRGDADGLPTLPLICHLWVSSDLTCCRMAYFYDFCHFKTVIFDAVDVPTPGWNHPNIGIVDRPDTFSKSIPFAGDPQCGDIGRWMNEINGAGTGLILAWGPSGAMPLTGTLEGSGIGNVSGQSIPINLAQTLKNQISLTYRNIPTMGLLRNQAFSDGGWHGRIFDIWWIPNDFNQGDTANLAGSNQFIIFRNQLHPWNGTPPILT